MRLAGPTPAQLISTRAGPCASAAFFTAASPLAESATSQATATPPISFAIVAAAASLISRTATRAPAAASARAVAAPRPDAPPVTIAACPLISMCPPEALGLSSYDARRGLRRIKLIQQRGAIGEHRALVDRTFVRHLAFVHRRRLRD